MNKIGSRLLRVSVYLFSKDLPALNHTLSVTDCVYQQCKECVKQKCVRYMRRQGV